MDEEGGCWDGRQVEVSVGWSSSSPKADFPFLNSADSSDPQTTPVRRADAVAARQAAGEDVSGARPTCNPALNVLGRYSALLPGSSPPRPRVAVRKRRTPPSPVAPQTRHGLRMPPSAAPSVAPSMQSESLPTPTALDPLIFSSDSDLEELAVVQHAPFRESYFKNKRALRFVVQRVEQGDDQLVLHVTDCANSPSRIELAGSWAESSVERGDMVHFIPPAGTSPKPGQDVFYVNDKAENLLVINPDILVSCTAVAESLNCERQVVLRARVRTPSDLNAPIVLGSIKHLLLQNSFQADALRDATAMLDILTAAAQAYRLDLSLVKLTVAQAVEQLQGLIGVIQQWAAAAWGQDAPGRSVLTHAGRQKMRVRLERAIYVEEEIRSPLWGLVGKIDVTAEATNLLDRRAGTRLAGLEIKTGKGFESVTHVAQTALYSLLLAERHPHNTQPWCLLYYTETGSTVAVLPQPRELRALVQRRNAVAHDLWLLPATQLPEPAAASSTVCNWCSRQDSCLLYLAGSEGGNTHGVAALGDLYTEATESGRLSPQFLTFVQHWQSLLDLEYEAHARYAALQSAQWWISGIAPIMWSPETVEKSDAGYEYVLRPRERPSAKPVLSQAAASSQPPVSQPVPLVAGERVIVSSKQHMGTSFGICLAADEQQLTVVLSSPLMMSGKYRVDADAYVSDHNLALARFNLHSLLSDDRLRRLIVDLAAPRFATLNSAKFDSTVERASTRVLYTESAAVNADDLMSSEDELTQSRAHGDLNADQRAALNKVLSAQDYALVLGMPGTGKTTTIAAIVSALVERGKSVLVSAYTHSAVDTIVQKLVSANVECVRFGRKDSVHPDVASVCLDLNNLGSQDDVNRFQTTPVVACTSHATNNRYFSLREFDVCILDEASQITLPFSLGPLRLAKSFVLVGDHFQLPPLVRNSLARERGLALSLFKILCDEHPDAVVELRRQYRMCSDIMSLSNELVYGGRLECGTEAVANQELKLPSLAHVEASHPYFFCAQPKNHVLFLSTDLQGEKSYEQEHNGGVSNQGEADVVSSVVRLLQHAGAPLRDIAVISVYRRQLSQITQQLQAEVQQGLEVITADQAQGRDKACIVVSLVRSNPEARTGELLKDWRRLNVAFTRAKQKLVIVGSAKMMQRADGVSRFYNYIKSRNWVYECPDTP